MIENLEMKVKYISDDCYSINVFGCILRTVSKYEEVDEFIEEFCEEWNVDSSTLIVNEL